MLGGIINTGSKVFMDEVTIQNEGMIIPFLSLPTTFPSCDWATIQIQMVGCVRSTQGTVVAGLPIPGWGPLGAPLLTLPYTPISGANVTIITAGFQQGLPLPSTQPAGGMGTLDAFSTPGNLYRLNVTVQPLAGVYGLKTYEFPVGPPGGWRVVISAGLVEADREFSE